MTWLDAASYTRQTLAGVFGRKFIHRRRYQAQCSRLSPARFQCVVDWSYGPVDYSGGVAVFYQLVGGRAEWSNRYRVSTVNGSCYSRTTNRKLCTVQIAHGSW
jgi:hypothetical protein